MNLKDILTLVIAAITAIPAIFGIYNFFKGVSWSLPKATKYSHILEKYVEYLDPQEIDFLKTEMKKDIKISILGIKNTGHRKLILYIRTHSELIMPSWRWRHIAPYIHYKYGKFFIPYKGKYRKNRLVFKFFAVFYVLLGFVCPCILWGNGVFFIFLSIFLMLLCFYIAFEFWISIPGKKRIKKYNTELLKIDGSNYQAK